MEFKYYIRFSQKDTRMTSRILLRISILTTLKFEFLDLLIYSF